MRVNRNDHTRDSYNFSKEDSYVRASKSMGHAPKIGTLWDTVIT